MKINLPGAFWVALVGAIVPPVTLVLQQYFPEAQYWWTALAVAALAAVAKAVQVALADKPTAPLPTAPAAASQGAPVDGDDYTYTTPPAPSRAMRVLFG